MELKRHRGAPLALALLAALVGCGDPPAAVFPTTEQLSDAPRKPDGVAIDPDGALPAPEDEASVQDGLVSLRAPLGRARAMDAITAFFDSVAREDADALGALLTVDALVVNAQGASPSGRNMTASMWWLQRFRRLDYTGLASETVFHPADIQIYRESDDRRIASQAPPMVSADALGEGDLVLRVPIATSRLGVDRLLSDEMLFWLRRDGEHYRIYRIMEDFQIP